MQTRIIKGNTVRFNLPAKDSRVGQIQVNDGAVLDFVKGPGFTIGSVVLEVQGVTDALVLQTGLSPAWTGHLSGETFGDPIAALTMELLA